MSADMLERARVDALIAIATCRSLITVASASCSGDTAVMLSALVGAIIVIAAGKPRTTELLSSAIAGLEDARGPVADSVRAIVSTSGGQPS